MIRWEILAEEPTPDGKSVMQLARRGDEYVIRVDRKDLMSSRMKGSEVALATQAASRLGTGVSRVLVGGLGLGFTLQAALEAFGGATSVVVAELVPAVVQWNREVFGHLSGNAVVDPRVEVVVGDVADLIRKPGQGFDAILLDVDNGPDALTQDDNAWLYTAAGLGACRSALKAGGVLGVWSAFDDPRFTRRLTDAGFKVDVVPVRAHGTKGARHTLWFAQVR